MNWKDEWERFTSDSFGRFAVGLTICLGILSIFYLLYYPFKLCACLYRPHRGRFFIFPPVFPPHRTPAPRSGPAPRGTSRNSPPGPSPFDGTSNTPAQAPGRRRPLGVFCFFDGIHPVAAKPLNLPADILDLSGQEYGLRRLRRRGHYAGQKDMDMDIRTRAFPRFLHLAVRQRLRFKGYLLAQKLEGGGLFPRTQSSPAILPRLNQGGLCCPNQNPERGLVFPYPCVQLHCFFFSL